MEGCRDVCFTNCMVVPGLTHSAKTLSGQPFSCLDCCESEACKSYRVLKLRPCGPGDFKHRRQSRAGDRSPGASPEVLLLAWGGSVRTLALLLKTTNVSDQGPDRPVV